MRVSVVITAFNLERFIGEAVDSALAQTHQPSEVIVVNDCSTDGTDAILRRYGNAIRYIALEANVGALRAAFVGARAATGELLAFLDGDDVWHREKLARCVEVFANDPAMILVSHQHARVDEARRPLGIYDDTHRNVDRILRATTHAVERSDAFKRAILEKTGYWLGSAYVVRRGVIDLEGFGAWIDTLPKPDHVYLDLTLAPYLVLTHPHGRLGMVDERLFEYRIHADNSCNDYRDVSRALRSVHRGYYTTLATQSLLRAHPESPLASDALRAHAKHIAYYELLAALYRDERAAALRIFVGLVTSGFFDARGVAKELARLGLVVLGGPQLFLRAKKLAA